jgi:hypothetical protein
MMATEYGHLSEHITLTKLGHYIVVAAHLGIPGQDYVKIKACAILANHVQTGVGSDEMRMHLQIIKGGLVEVGE